MSNVITNNNLNCELALTALQNVIDPEIGLNIVDLGLIYQLDFDEAAKKIYCTMTLTTRFCPMGESIADAAKETLELTFPGYGLLLELTFSPPWNHDLISEAGRNFLIK